MSEAAISHIAVFGRRRELWPVAALLARSLPDRIALTIVEEPGDAAQPAAVTLPLDSAFHRALSLEAGDFVAEAQAGLGLGTEYVGWRGEGSRFFSAASGSLPSIDGITLHHVLLRAARTYETADRLAHLYAPFRFCARVAEAGKMALGADRPSSPLAMLGPTVQCDADAYAGLFENCVGEGAQRCQGTPEAVQVEDGVIESVRLAGGRDLEADLFVDVSGALARLVPAEAGRRAWQIGSAFDGVASMSSDRSADHHHTRTAALPGGLLIETPFGQGCISTLAFSSAHMTEDDVRQELGGEANPTPLESFALDTPWTRNCVRLGTASARFGPFASADMQLLQAQALDLAALIPATRRMAAEAGEFNRGHLQSVAQIGDFAAAPLHLNARDEPFWAALRDTEPSSALRIRLDQFASRGRLATFDREAADEQTWIEMLIGFGIVPARYDRRTDALDMVALAPRLKALAGRFDRAIAEMPTREDFVRRFAER